VTLPRVPAGLRLWLAALGVVIAVAAGLTAIITSGAPSHGAPVHAMQTRRQRRLPRR
jgi:hypothetical protein